MPKIFQKQASMRIGKVSNFVNFLSNNKNFQVKQKGIDFTATKFVQVTQRVLVTTAIAVKKIRFCNRMLCDKLRG